MSVGEMPKAGPLRSVPLPHAHEMRLDNGLRVIAIARGEVPTTIKIPLISAVITFDVGGTQDPLGRAGVAAMTSALLSAGTKRRSALELGVVVDALGARLDKSAAYDSSASVASATTGMFPQALDLLAETVRESTFAEEEFERIRSRSLSDLKLAYSSPSSLARLVASRVVSGDSPYGHPLSGTLASLNAMTREDVLAFHAHAYRPERATLLIGGEITYEAAFELARKVFGDWRPDPRPEAELASAPLPAPRKRVVVVNKADAGRTAVTITRSSISRSSEDYYAGVVTAAALSGYSGRLNQEVRVKRGLSYGAGASLITRRRSGQFVASTLVDHTKAIETVGVILDTLASLSSSPPAGAELAARKASLLGGWNRSIDSNDGLLGALADYALYGVPLDELERYTGHIERTGTDEIQAFAGQYIVPDSSIVLVGDATAFIKDLAGLADDVKVIPFADLDLDRAI